MSVLGENGPVIRNLILPTLLLLTLNPLQAETEIRVTGSRVTLRASPEISPENMVGVARRGDRLRLLGESGDWYQVRLADGESAWLNRNFAEVLPDAEPVDPDESPLPRADTTGSPDRQNAVEPVPDSARPASLTADATTGPGEAVLGEPAVPAESPSTHADPAPDRVEERRAESLPGELSGAEPIPSWNASLLGALAGAGLALVATGGFLFVSRRRRQSELMRGRVGVPISKQDLQVVFGKLDEVRRAEDDRLRAHFHRLKATASSGEQELARLHGRIDELKASVTGQQQRLDSYSDLLAAQNRKIEVLEEENRVLRALLQGPQGKL